MHTIRLVWQYFDMFLKFFAITFGEDLYKMIDN